MPVRANLPKPKGRGTRKFFTDTVAITGTGDVDTGLRTIEDATATVVNAGTTMPTHTATISAVDGGTVSVVVVEHDTASNAVATAEKSISIIAEGY